MRAVSSANSDELAHLFPEQPTGTDQEIACQIARAERLQATIAILEQRIHLYLMFLLSNFPSQL